MIQFKKLRLSGFKSFVDKTELDIGQGLTGVVGPNGCGKSNLVEALRWVMGESSAKRMRGSGRNMEDVIFSGTSTRPARNFAEVSLLLDNSSLSAPAAYNTLEEIEVTRKIERDHGSLYKINGKTSRARDVQMLFADTVTGANSPALVSQGRVTAMINAKPQERRLILEESAGISGLYARRHEAELRLRAADSNLQRIEDLVGSMESRLGALKKQVRQASKYKSLSARIRELEVSVAYLEWRILCNKIEQRREKFAACESRVAEHMTTVTQLTKTQSVQSEDIPALRNREAELSAALQTHKLTLQRLEDQEQTLENHLRETKEQLERLKSDRAHEQQSLQESSETLEKLSEEEQKLQDNQANETDFLQEKIAIKDRLEEKVSKLESEYETFMASAAETKASRQAIEQKLASEKSRLLVLDERLDKLNEDLAKAREQFDQDNEPQSLKDDIKSLEETISHFRDQLEKNKPLLEQQQQDLDTARETLQESQTKKSEVETEIKTLRTLLHDDAQSEFRPVLEDIQPDKGFETALSRALGDTLMASTEDNAPVIWESRDLDIASFPALPEGAEKLAPHVKAPAPLQAALHLIGIVKDEQEGRSLASELKPGQSLVSTDGAYWRWDGLHIKASASDRHALQLQQKNRLKDLEKELPALEAGTDKARTALEGALNARNSTQSELETLQAKLRENEQALEEKRKAFNRMTEQRSELFAQIAKFEEGISNTQQEKETLSQTIAASEKDLEEYDEAAMSSQAEQVDKVREALTEARNGLREALRELDTVKQEQSRRQARLHAIADERLNLQNRTIRSKERLKELDERETQLQEKLQTLTSRPKSIDDDKNQLLEKISNLETQRAEAADHLAEKESELAQTNKALKEAEGELAQAREERASIQATAAAGQEHLTEIVSSIKEHFDTEPEALIGETDLKIGEDQSLPEIDPLKTEKEQLIRQRDQIGPVNLRAEAEAEELEKEVGGILEERSDLVQAIDELREGINTLNKEARERLMSAFDHVNGHFQNLFVRLFGGGQAHLSLIESDDPLESGLEIFAQPPGKTLQSLSLLSGGEQTLASIALIFAMFLTNPSPICVLDEIDAPLDDANVDRVCDLLEEIAERGETRFLVITHHRLTMARMDRLYGVTMAERGVSQLVSVDLNKQIDFLEAAE